jgi:hypothetical protein
MVATLFLGTSCSFGAEEMSLAKDMTKVTKLRQSFINNLLIKSRTRRKRHLN